MMFLRARASNRKSNISYEAQVGNRGLETQNSRKTTRKRREKRSGKGRGKSKRKETGKEKTKAVCMSLGKGKQR
jgi:hypothetical protein